MQPSTMRPFETIHDATNAVLSLVHSLFGLRTAFVSQTTNDRFIVATVLDNGGCRLVQGTRLPLKESY